MRDQALLCCVICDACPSEAEGKLAMLQTRLRFLERLCSTDSKKFKRKNDITVKMADWHY